MRRLVAEIDLHVVAMLVLLAPTASLGFWWLAAPLLIPQGRIYVQAFWDFPRSGHRERTLPYVAANEIVVLFVVGGLAVLRLAFAANGIDT